MVKIWSEVQIRDLRVEPGGPRVEYRCRCGWSFSLLMGGLNGPYTERCPGCGARFFIDPEVGSGPRIKEEE